MNALKDLIHGTGSHVDPIAAVEDLTWELAGRRVLHLPHTIWQQGGHLNYWIDFGLKAIEGARPNPPKTTWCGAMNWPCSGPTSIR